MLTRFIAACLLASGLTISTTAVSAPAQAVAGKPNVVMILTDDMRKDDMKYMDFTRRLFANEGVTFTDAISNHPVCCPARAELITGQLGQNSGVYHNGGPRGGWDSMYSKQSLIFNWFGNVGYKTGYVGKFLNGYKGGNINGVDDNQASVKGVYSPFGVTTYNNGSPTKRKGHQTIFTGRKIRGMIDQWRDKPFFLWAGFMAPHKVKWNGSWQPSIPPRGYDTFEQAGDGTPQSMSKPSFNTTARGGASYYKGDVDPASVTKSHGRRVRSLYAVDDEVRKIVNKLKNRGLWNNTILVFASDNGYGMGSHKWMDKNMPLQDVLSVPMMMTGPGLPNGTEVNSPVMLADIPSTLDALTPMDTGRVQDGRNALTRPETRAILIQGGKPEAPYWMWRGVYTTRYIYARWDTREIELFDRHMDPHQLDNVMGTDPASGYLRDIAAELETCRGSSCQRTY